MAKGSGGVSVAGARRRGFSLRQSGGSIEISRNGASGGVYRLPSGRFVADFKRPGANPVSSHGYGMDTQGAAISWVLREFVSRGL